MEGNQCLKNVATNFGIGATLGSSIGRSSDAMAMAIGRVLINTFLHIAGAVYGTFDAFRFKVQSGGLATVLLHGMHHACWQPVLSASVGRMLAASASIIDICMLAASSACHCRLHAGAQCRLPYLSVSDNCIWATTVVLL